MAHFVAGDITGHLILAVSKQRASLVCPNVQRLGIRVVRCKKRFSGFIYLDDRPGISYRLGIFGCSHRAPKFGAFLRPAADTQSVLLWRSGDIAGQVIGRFVKAVECVHGHAIFVSVNFTVARHLHGELVRRLNRGE